MITFRASFPDRMRNLGGLGGIGAGLRLIGLAGFGNRCDYPRSLKHYSRSRHRVVKPGVGSCLSFSVPKPVVQT